MKTFEEFTAKYPVFPIKTGKELRQPKIDLITGIGKAASLRDYGGLWGVCGLYLLEGATALGCKYAEMVDVTPLEEFSRKVSELKAKSKLHVEMTRADFRNPKLFETMASVDVSLLYNVMLHQDNVAEVIKNVLSKTNQFVCLAQPVLKEELFCLPNGCVNLQFYPDKLKTLLRPDCWDEELTPNEFDTRYWMWGQTVSYFQSVFHGYQWKIEHLEIYELSQYWNTALIRFVPSNY